MSSAARFTGLSLGCRSHSSCVQGSSLFGAKKTTACNRRRESAVECAACRYTLARSALSKSKKPFTFVFLLLLPASRASHRFIVWPGQLAHTESTRCATETASSARVCATTASHLRRVRFVASLFSVPLHALQLCAKRGALQTTSRRASKAVASGCGCQSRSFAARAS